MFGLGGQRLSGFHSFIHEEEYSASAYEWQV